MFVTYTQRLASSQRGRLKKVREAQQEAINIGQIQLIKLPEEEVSEAQKYRNQL